MIEPSAAITINYYHVWLRAMIGVLVIAAWGIPLIIVNECMKEHWKHVGRKEGWIAGIDYEKQRRAEDKPE